MFIDNIYYDGFIFFSFCNFSDYTLNNIKNNTLCLAHPSSFNEPIDIILLRWNQHLQENARNDIQRKFRILYQKVYTHINVRRFVRIGVLPRELTLNVE